METRAMVSVVIPVYNTPEGYLLSCVDSALQQTHSSLEVLLVDDGSQKATADLCDCLAQRDERIRVIHQENGGVSRARNAGIEAACGEYLCFLDADDVLHPRFVELLLQAAQKYDVPVTACEIWHGSAEDPTFTSVVQAKMAAWPGQDAWKHLNGGYCWNKLYRRDLIADVRYAPGIALLEDFLFVNLCLVQAERCAKVDEKLYYYRKNDSSATRRMKPEKYAEAVTVCDRVYGLYAERNVQEACRWITAFRAEWSLRYLVALASQKEAGWNKRVKAEKKAFAERDIGAASKLVAVSLRLAKLPNGLFCLYLRLLVLLRRIKK